MEIMPGMSLGARIRQARTAKKVSQTTIAGEMGVTREAVSQWESDTSEPSATRLRKLAVYLDVDFNWLATNRGGHSSVTLGLPLRGVIAAGVWREVVESQDMGVRRVPVAPDPRWPVSAQYVLKVEGNSVNRVAKDGTLLHCIDILEGGVEIRDDDLVVVERSRGDLVETTVKRLRKGRRGLELWPESDDAAHQNPIPVAAKGGEVTVKAIVIFVTSPVSRAE